MTETRVLTSFESSSVRCLTRQEESLLQAAVAMTIVKKRFQEQRKKARLCHVETLFALPPPTTTKLLPKPLPDHMDHMLQVASRFEGRTLEGVASHLVQQLDAWIQVLLPPVRPPVARQPREKHLEAIATTSTTGGHPVVNKMSATELTRHATDGSTTSPPLLSKGIDPLTPIHDWMAKRLLASSPQASSTAVFHAIIMQSGKKQLLDCWWHVLSTLIHQIDHGTLPQSPAACSLDRFAVILLELLQTLATTTTTLSLRRHPDDHHHHGPFVSSITIPPLLQDLMYPLPTPTNLSTLLWNFTEDLSASRRTATVLSPGARLLLRLGLCRILLVPPETPRVLSPPNPSSTASWRTLRNNGWSIPSNNQNYR